MIDEAAAKQEALRVAQSRGYTTNDLVADVSEAQVFRVLLTPADKGGRGGGLTVLVDKETGEALAVLPHF